MRHTLDVMKFRRLRQQRDAEQDALRAANRDVRLAYEERSRLEIADEGQRRHFVSHAAYKTTHSEHREGHSPIRHQERVTTDPALDRALKAIREKETAAKQRRDQLQRAYEPLAALSVTASSLSTT